MLELFWLAIYLRWTHPITQNFILICYPRDSATHVKYKHTQMTVDLTTMQLSLA